VEYFAAIDVSLEASSLCILDEKGTIVRETKVASDPESLAKALAAAPGPLVRVGLEAGPLSQWLHAGRPCPWAWCRSTLFGSGPSLIRLPWLAAE